MRRALVGVLIAIGSLLVLYTPSLLAETVNITIGVGDTILKVSGKTSPDAFVTISKDGSVIGTATADSTGVYGQVFTAQEPGLHQLQLYARTITGANTDTVSLTVNIAEHATTIIDVFLPSTLDIQDTTLEQEQTLELAGESLPNSTVSLYIDNTIYTSTTTDGQGRWNMIVPSSSWAAGQHTIFVRVTDNLGSQSYPTLARYFTLAEKEGVEARPPDPQTPRPRVPSVTFPKANPQPGQTPQEPLYIHVPQTRVVVYAGEPLKLRAIVLNSRQPYDIVLDWNNGQRTFFTSSSNELLFERIYTEVGTYNVTATVQDTAGRKGTVYFTVEVLPRESNVSPDFILFILILLILLALYLSRKKSQKSSVQKD